MDEILRSWHSGVTFRHVLAGRVRGVRGWSPRMGWGADRVGTLDAMEMEQEPGRGEPGERRHEILVWSDYI